MYCIAIKSNTVLCKSLHVTSKHITSHHTTSNYNTADYITLYFITSHHTKSIEIISHRTTPTKLHHSRSQTLNHTIPPPKSHQNAPHHKNSTTRHRTTPHYKHRATPHRITSHYTSITSNHTMPFPCHIIYYIISYRNGAYPQTLFQWGTTITRCVPINKVKNTVTRACGPCRLKTLPSSNPISVWSVVAW